MLSWRGIFATLCYVWLLGYDVMSQNDSLTIRHSNEGRPATSITNIWKLTKFTIVACCVTGTIAGVSCAIWVWLAFPAMLTWVWITFWKQFTISRQICVLFVVGVHLLEVRSFPWKSFHHMCILLKITDPGKTEGYSPGQWYLQNKSK